LVGDKNIMLSGSKKATQYDLRDGSIVNKKVLEDAPAAMTEVLFGGKNVVAFSYG